MTIEEFLPWLDGVKQRGSRWSARCPAHADRSPSLSVSEGDKGVLLKCWAGCSVVEICQSLGIEQRDLFFDALDSNPKRRKHPAPPARLDRRAQAFRFELAALDLRLRAERIAQAGTLLPIGSLTDTELDRALALVARGHADIERAEMFEDVADGLRFKEFFERESRERTRAA